MLVAAPRAAHRLAVESNRPSRPGGWFGARLGPAPIAESSSSPFRRCTVRRIVDSHGAHPPTSSAARIWPEAGAVHSPIAVKERQPAKTAQTASAKDRRDRMPHTPSCAA